VSAKARPRTSPRIKIAMTPRKQKSLEDSTLRHCGRISLFAALFAPSLWSTKDVVEPFWEALPSSHWCNMEEFGGALSSIPFHCWAIASVTKQGSQVGYENSNIQSWRGGNCTLDISGRLREGTIFYKGVTNKGMDQGSGFVQSSFA